MRGRRTRGISVSPQREIAPLETNREEEEAETSREDRQAPRHGERKTGREILRQMRGEKGRQAGK